MIVAQDKLVGLPVTARTSLRLLVLVPSDVEELPMLLRNYEPHIADAPVLLPSRLWSSDCLVNNSPFALHSMRDALCRQNICLLALRKV